MAEMSPFLEESFQDDPYPAIHRLREQDPVHLVPKYGFWFVTRHDDCRQLFTDPRVTPDTRAYEHYVAPPEGTFLRWVTDNGFLSLPKDEHARLRRFVSAVFTPRAVARMEGHVKEVVERYGAPLHGRKGVVDLLSEYANPIPNAVISRITGVPPAGEDEDRFRQLAQDAIKAFFTFASEEVKQLAERAFLELSDWVREMATERRRSPREDLISDLVHVREGRDHLKDDEVVLLVTGLLAAGSETTAMGGMVSLMTLLEHPEVLERLRGDRSLLPQAVLEILRWGFGGPGGLPRYAVRDFELRGQSIRKGQMLMLSFGGANRDPAVYEDPDRFDIDRNPKDLLTFGTGPHFCLGANLAKQELRCMVDGALDFLPPGARFIPDQMETSDIGTFRRPESFPVDFG